MGKQKSSPKEILYCFFQHENDINNCLLVRETKHKSKEKYKKKKK